MACAVCAKMQASLRCLRRLDASVSMRRSQGASKGASQAPERLSALRFPSLAARVFPGYGATGAAKHTGGEALPMRMRMKDALGCSRQTTSILSTRTET